MTNKVYFDREYEKLFNQVIRKINRNTISNFSKVNQQFNINDISNSPLRSQKVQLNLNNQQIKSHDHQNKHKQQQQNQQSQTLKQTTYYVFGQASKGKSLEMRRTFVNFGNNRYQINKNIATSAEKPNPEKSSPLKPNALLLSNMDNLDTNTFNIKNLNFPKIGQGSKAKKNKVSQLSPLKSYLDLGQQALQTQKSFFRKRKNSRLAHSLEINNRLRANKSQNSNYPSHGYKNLQLMFQNNLKQNKSIYSIQQIQKKLKVDSNEYLKQLLFNKDEHKLLEMEKNIVRKRRADKAKLREKMTEKQILDPWKHQITHQNPTDELYDVFDHVKAKVLF